MAKEIIDIDQIQQSYEEPFLTRELKIERAVTFLLGKDMIGYTAQKVAEALKPFSRKD